MTDRTPREQNSHELRRLLQALRAASLGDLALVDQRLQRASLATIATEVAMRLETEATFLAVEPLTVTLQRIGWPQ